jgi:hypothetical protein
MAWYKTGTVAVTNASTTVTGTGTNFVSGAQVGDGFLGPNELLYEITAINSATSLTIAPAYGGATASSQNYAIAPTQGLVASLASDVTDLITDYQSVVDNAGAGKFGDGSAASPAIRFTNDQDTGFFRDTANEIAFATAGVKRGEFRSSGIQLLDGQKFIAGTGNDLSIFHNGSASIIEDSGTGGITLRSDIFTVQNAAGNETVAQFVQDGFVKLFHNNSQVFTTISTGASITGSLGIGTSSPASLLHLEAAEPVIRIKDSDGAAYHQIFGNTSDLYIDADRGNNASSNIIFRNDASEAMRIDSSGNVGIGTSSPAFSSGYGGLHVHSTYPEIHLTGLNSGSGVSDGFKIQKNTSNDVYLWNYENALMVFGTNNAEAIRIDASRNLLVGTTTYNGPSNASSGDYGAAIWEGGLITAGTNASEALILNRMNSDGDIAVFKRGGSAVGIVGVNSGNNLYISSSASDHSGLEFSFNTVIPQRGGTAADNIVDLGASSFRYDDIFATNGTIQTSDRNEKQDIAELSDAEQRVAVAAKGLLRKFRWKDAVAEKGDEARTHFGIIAQDLQAAFAAEGLDAGDYAMFISSTWTDEETGEERTRMGVRYSELLAFIISAI